MVTRNFTRDELTAQVAQIVKECQSVKPGMTRADLMKVFTTEGGFQHPNDRTFVHRSCPYIKVDVKLKPVHSDERSTAAEPTDIISSISRPYLAWSIAD